MERALTTRLRQVHPELDELLARLADGERAAFQPLFDALWPLLRPFCVRFLASEADGEDAAQQALLKVFARARDYDPSRPALPWILTIATNECRTLRKQRLRRKEVGSEPLDPLTAPRPSPEHAVIAADLQRALSAIVSELRPAELETLAAALADTKAPRPAVPAATFRKRVERALSRVRLAWRSKYGAL